MRKPGGRTVAVVAGGLALTIALVCWKHIAIRYYLERLRNDPTRLKEFAAAPDGSLAREAVLRFIRTEAGGKVLVGSFLGTLTAWFEEFEGRKGKDNPIPDSKTAIVSLLGNAVEWRIVGQTFNGTGSFDVEGGDHTALGALLPHLRGAVLRLDDHPEHFVSVLSVAEISEKLAREPGSQQILDGFAGGTENQTAILFEHRVFRLPAESRLIGSWECAAAEGRPLIFGSARFLPDGTFVLSKLPWAADGGYDAAGETVHEGIYGLEGGTLRLRYRSGDEEAYSFEFTRADELILRSHGTMYAFRRPSDVPEEWRNKIGIRALEGKD